MTDYADLIARYKMIAGTKTSRERAVLEKEILEEVARSMPQVVGVDRHEWLGKCLGVSGYVVECSSRLLSFGDVAAPVWARVDADMSVGTAVSIMRRAWKRAGEDGCEMSVAIDRTLADYDALPNLSRLPDGKFLRKKGLTSLPREVGEKRPPRASVKSDGVRDFWAGLRSMIGDHFRVRLHGLDSMAVEQAWRGLETDLKVVLEQHIHKIDRLRRSHAERSMMVSRGKILAAYNALHLEPPKPGGEIDLKVARRQFRKLASLHHPDRSGTEETRPLYEAVVEAFRIIEESHEVQGGR